MYSFNTSAVFCVCFFAPGRIIQNYHYIEEVPPAPEAVLYMLDIRVVLFTHRPETPGGRRGPGLSGNARGNIESWRGRENAAGTVESPTTVLNSSRERSHVSLPPSQLGYSTVPSCVRPPLRSSVLQGTMQWASGKEYRGDWKAGKRDGEVGGAKARWLLCLPFFYLCCSCS